MSKVNPICRKCSAKLVVDENWYPCSAKLNNRICNRCAIAYGKQRYKDNPKARNGQRPFTEARECSLFLGCYVAESVLKRVFNNVKMMPMHNRRFDFICNRDKRVDVKSACLGGNWPRWSFLIDRNEVADHFLCLAFDNREDLNPMHLWLIPGDVVNDHARISVSPSTVSKWDKYALPIDKVVACCDAMK